MRIHVVLKCAIIVSWFGCVNLLLAEPASDASPKAAPGPAIQSSPETAIRASSQAFCTAFNKHDAKAVASLWTVTGEYADENGHHFVGRDAIQKAYQTHFSENPQAKIRVLVDSVRLLSDSAAIEDGRAIVEPVQSGPPGIGKYTAVHVKVDGKWLLASVRDAWQETPSTYAKLADLEWLIGRWTAEEQGIKIESTCRWLGNKSFIERKFLATSADGITTNGVQIVGWNSQAAQVESWTFNADGSHAIGRWATIRDGWAAEVRGVAVDGTLTTAVNSLKRLDDNAYSWRSVRRTSGEKTLPDSEEVIWRRQPPGR